MQTTETLRDISDTCEKAAESSAFGSCFRVPFHRTPTRASGRFNIFWALAPSAQRASTTEPLLTFSTSPLPQRAYFGSTSSVPVLYPAACAAFFYLSRSDTAVHSIGLHETIHSCAFLQALS